MNRIIKLLNNRLVQMAISAVAMYFAYKTVDLSKVVSRISTVPIWFVVFLVIYTYVVGFLASVRWGVLLFGKPDFKKLWIMYKAATVGGFYSMFLPTPLAGDGFKWVRSADAFSDVPKSKILGSILVDRVIGLSTLVTMGVCSVILATIFGIKIDPRIITLVVGMFFGVATILFLIWKLDFTQLAKKHRFLTKLAKIDEAFMGQNRQYMFRAAIVSFFAQIVWILPGVFASWFFVPGLPVLLIYTYMPIISLLLALPISFGGFGAREALYTLFFVPYGFSA